MRALTPVEGKKAIIIDYVNNVQRHGFPTMQREWSLDKPVKEYDNENNDGTFKIRVCQNCFSTFETAPVCPYCGAEYETTPIEIENFKQIELKKIEEEKEIKRQRYLNNIANKVKEYKSAKECQNWVELTQFVKEKGYKPGYAYILAKQMKIPFRKEIKMKEIIFWFNSYKLKNYWFDYAASYCSSKFKKAIRFDAGILRYSRVEDWIQIGNLKIKFKVDRGENHPQHAGTYDTNQYWVEELFDNNFEEFFMSIVKREINNG